MPKRKFTIEQAIGLILLIPPTIGVIFFLINLFISNPGPIPTFRNLGIYWTGGYYNPSFFNSEYPGRSAGGGGFTSAVPIYMGLMAIAGAILVKPAR